MTIKIINLLINIVRLDWKPYALALFGFLLGAVANQIGARYGIVFGGILILIGWLCVLGSLLIAHRNDLPLYKIFRD